MTKTFHRRTLIFKLDQNMDEFDQKLDFQFYSPVNVHLFFLKDGGILWPLFSHVLIFLRGSRAGCMIWCFTTHSRQTIDYKPSSIDSSLW